MTQTDAPIADAQKAAAIALVERILSQIPDGSAAVLRHDPDLMQAVQTWTDADIQRLPMEWREVLTDVLRRVSQRVPG